MKAVTGAAREGNLGSRKGFVLFSLTEKKKIEIVKTIEKDPEEKI